VLSLLLKTFRLQLSLPLKRFLLSQTRPQQEIVGDLNESNIVEGTGTRKPSRRHQAYLTDLARPDELPAYHSAFTLGTKAGHPRIQQDDLPPPLRSWKSYRVIDRARTSRKLQRKNTRASKCEILYRSYQRRQISKLFPLTWVFTYKLDTNSYLTKFKAHICVRGDLQSKSNKETCRNARRPYISCPDSHNGRIRP
jgi:hypothetical protein